MKRSVEMVSALACALGLIASAGTIPDRAFYHNGQGGCVLDVTKPPFNAKGDGVQDDTKALSAALRFIRDNLRQVTHSGGESICCQVKDKNWIVYLPNGVYRVTDTVCQGWPALALDKEYGWSHIRLAQVSSLEQERTLERLDAASGRGRNSVYAEANWQIVICGESREGTVVKLDDRVPGFGKMTGKSVLSFFMLNRGSNVSLGNFLSDLTIDVGRGNPGAVGVKWVNSNYGGLRNVLIRSADGTGAIGVDMPRRNACGYFRDVEVDGFAVGMSMFATGMFPGSGPASSLVVEDSRICRARVGFQAGGDGAGLGTNIFNLRNVAFDEVGTKWQKRESGLVVVAEGDEWRDIPRMSGANSGKVATPDDFGAVGDGVHDDTGAFVAAFTSGCEEVVLTRPLYRIDGVVPVPASVRRVRGLHAAIVRCSDDPAAVFRIEGESENPLFVVELAFAGGVLIDHVSERHLVVYDVYTEFHHMRADAARDAGRFPVGASLRMSPWRTYRNATPDKRKLVFAADNVSLFGAESNGEGALENVELHARYVNNEHFPGAAYAFRHCKARVLGGKSEDQVYGVLAEKGSDVILHGLTCFNWTESNVRPFVRVVDSQLDMALAFWHQRNYPCCFAEIMREGQYIQITGSRLSKVMISEDAAFIRFCSEGRRFN